MATINDMAALVSKTDVTAKEIDEQLENIQNATTSLMPVLSVHREDVGHLE